jgi:hypothetical protein
VVGVAANYSLQMSYPQKLGNKGLTGVFWRFLLFLYRIVIFRNKEPLHFSSIFSSKSYEAWRQAGGARWVSRWFPYYDCAPGAGNDL